VAAILSEDTRSVRKLLSHFHIATRAQAFHEHNELHETPRVVARLLGGEDFALVSDAGTPLLADPGYRLVRACREEGIPVLAVPGPSAVAAAVSVAGLPPYPFTFAGFLSPRSGARQRTLTELADLPHTLVVFLSPHRLANELADCSRTLGGQRQAVVLAELTKVHERAATGTLEELAAQAATTKPRGEYTLVVGPPVAHERLVAATPGAARAALAVALEEGNDLPAARRAAARRLGITRRQLYGLIEQDDGE
jgi:16S rRNA (cytidine1402-2'-O)-methyltransferase